MNKKDITLPFCTYIVEGINNNILHKMSGRTIKWNKGLEQRRAGILIGFQGINLSRSVFSCKMRTVIVPTLGFWCQIR